MIDQNLDNKLEAFLLDFQKSHGRDFYGYEVVSFNLQNLIDFNKWNATSNSNKNILVGNIKVNTQLMSALQNAGVKAIANFIPSAVVCCWGPNTITSAISSSIDSTNHIRHVYVYDDTKMPSNDYFIIANSIWIGSKKTAGAYGLTAYDMSTSLHDWSRLDLWYTNFQALITAVDGGSRILDCITFDGYLVNVNY